MFKIINPEGWKKAKGYSNGILTEDGVLYMGGQIGWNSHQIFEDFTFIGQMEQILHNILAIVYEAGGEVKNIVRLTWYIRDKTDYLANQKNIGKIYQKVMGKHFPAMTVVIVRDLIEDEAILEIEATAIIK